MTRPLPSIETFAAVVRAVALARYSQRGHLFATREELDMILDDPLSHWENVQEEVELALGATIRHGVVRVLDDDEIAHRRRLVDDEARRNATFIITARRAGVSYLP